MRRRQTLALLAAFVGAIVVGGVVWLFVAPMKERQASAERTATTREQELIQQLADGTPQEKMDASTQLKQMRSIIAVPYLLVEVRDKYGPIIYEDAPNSDAPHDRLAFVIRNGEKVPYVDYHEPLFDALSELAIPYFEPDRKWFAALGDWVRDKGMSHLLDRLTGASNGRPAKFPTSRREQKAKGLNPCESS